MLRYTYLASRVKDKAGGKYSNHWALKVDEFGNVIGRIRKAEEIIT